MSENKVYHSPFKRVRVSDQGSELIQQLQNDFDGFWRKVNRVADTCPEKFHALKAMQEACMWLSRACAIKHHKAKKEVPQPTHAERVKSIEESIFGVSSTDSSSFVNCPKIVFKKKKL